MKEGLRRLLVVNGGRRLVGIATIDDLVEALAVEMTDLAEALRGGLAREEAAQAGLEPLRRPDGARHVARPTLAPHGLICASRDAG